MREGIKIGITLMLGFYLLGMMLNFGVMSEYEGKMPVYSGIEDNRHISFNNTNEVKLYYLTDIYPLGTSIGDIFMIIGFICGITSYIFIVFSKDKLQKQTEGDTG